MAASLGWREREGFDRCWLEREKPRVSVAGTCQPRYGGEDQDWGRFSHLLRTRRQTGQWLRGGGVGRLRKRGKRNFGPPEHSQKRGLEPGKRVGRVEEI